MFKIKIDNQVYEASAKEMTGEQILQLAGKNFPEWSLSLNRDGKSIAIGKDEQVDLGEIGDGDFTTKLTKPKRPGGKVSIKIDKDEYEVSRTTLTGEEILALAGKNYEGYSLNEKLKSGRRRAIEADQDVDLTNPEIDRFETTPRQAQQGNGE